MPTSAGYFSCPGCCARNDVTVFLCCSAVALSTAGARGARAALQGRAECRAPPTKAWQCGSRCHTAMLFRCQQSSDVCACSGVCVCVCVCVFTLGGGGKAAGRAGAAAARGEGRSCQSLRAAGRLSLFSARTRRTRQPSISISFMLNTLCITSGSSYATYAICPHTPHPCFVSYELDSRLLHSRVFFSVVPSAAAGKARAMQHTHTTAEPHLFRLRQEHIQDYAVL